jgi:hypothetical protein
MLAAPNGPKTLAEIEERTKQGHGLYTFDGPTDRLDQLAVGLITSGFFVPWIRSMGLSADDIPAKKIRHYEELASNPDSTWILLETLFASIPELADLFADIFETKPRWIKAGHDMSANRGFSMFTNAKPVSRSYVLLVDDTARLTAADIALFPGPISEITEVTPEGAGRHFRVAVDHAIESDWRQGLPLHNSPFIRDALIQPIFGVLQDYRAICVVLLYALSIVVRYRPSVWRRVQEGDLDHMRALIRALLSVVERVLPQQFLEKIIDQRVHVTGQLFAS